MSRRKAKFSSDKIVSFVVIVLVVLIAVFIYNKTDSKNGKNKNFEEKNIETKNAQTVLENKDEEKYNLVHFIDVGQGDSILVESKNGKFVLIDAGTGKSEDKLLSYLNSRNVKEIEYAVFTHPHEDHIGSADAVVDSFKVKNVYMTGTTANTACFDRLLTSLSNSKKDNGTVIKKPKNDDTFSVDGIKFTVLSDGKDYDDTNNTSICLRMSMGESSFVFTGDAEKEVEKDILERNVNVEADVYKGAHHGSTTSNTEDFVKAVNPKVCVISCGVDNDYGHPHDEILELMDKLGVSVHRTDLEGDVVIAFDEKDVFYLGE